MRKYKKQLFEYIREQGHRKYLRKRNRALPWFIPSGQQPKKTVELHGTLKTRVGNQIIKIWGAETENAVTVSPWISTQIYLKSFIFTHIFIVSCICYSFLPSFPWVLFLFLFWKIPFYFLQWRITSSKFSLVFIWIDVTHILKDTSARKKVLWFWPVFFFFFF